MSESVASALQFVNEEGTRETRLFIRMIDRFFDNLNVKSTKHAEWKRKDSIAPYMCTSDERFKVYFNQLYNVMTFCMHGLAVVKERLRELSRRVGRGDCCTAS